MKSLQTGSTQLILDACAEHRTTLEQTAYILATAYWETAKTMEPVKEAFWLSEDWRRRYLRYYPWYGRGFVQLTWQENYVRAGDKLGMDFVTDPDVVMQPEISAQILVRGMLEGWFTSKKLGQYVDEGRKDYRNARRVVNGTDKATTIAEIASQYEALLVGAAHGDTVISAPVPGRTNVAQSTTLQSAVVGGVSTVAGAVAAVSELDGPAQYLVIGTAALAVLMLMWIARERIRKWAEGDR